VYAGHLGIALAAKGWKPGIPLAVLALATQLPDWIDGLMCLLGCRWGPFENYSHSLPAIAFHSLVIASVYAAFTRDIRGSLVVAAAAVSHVFADYITGLKPTWPGGPRIGLQWYAHPVRDFVLEAAVIAVGWMIYQRTLSPRGKRSPESWAIPLSLVALQLVADVFVISHRVGKCAECLR
jgi:hypothetical protein